MGKRDIIKAEKKNGNIKTHGKEIMDTVEECYRVQNNSRREVDINEGPDPEYTTAKKGIINQSFELLPNINSK